MHSWSWTELDYCWDMAMLQKEPIWSTRKKLGNVLWYSYISV